ncbi:uncharacterized protein LOC6500154 isoform X3 [Drosophila ananassae]|uniref:uncharacterized protein LOC6500154 isoform X3 n=1 Tax=Drosophila ananassae TaxID=7217 RepID=UPI001CFF6CDC|nr:uncharacterized protein LOC6500154 isoform X3 [Drosophila ananassae]
MRQAAPKMARATPPVRLTAPPKTNLEHPASAMTTGLERSEMRKMLAILKCRRILRKKIHGYGTWDMDMDIPTLHFPLSSLQSQLSSLQSPNRSADTDADENCLWAALAGKPRKRSCEIILASSVRSKASMLRQTHRPAAPEDSPSSCSPPRKRSTRSAPPRSTSSTARRSTPRRPRRAMARSLSVA